MLFSAMISVLNKTTFSIMWKIFLKLFVSLCRIKYLSKDGEMSSVGVKKYKMLPWLFQNAVSLFW